ncbi:MAG: hypothetical protein R8N23_03360 [Reichenbachiella sp.]|uniref:hypothetical protein n=1 Tax=Reichenbachiella sp. TaxID=2184521 RepID=UPI002966FD33|nr:hypothetical protein [Reichenbachiella sp.]MDW3208876.1 hypothetical protein [Reichenbachiella sp.]
MNSISNKKQTLEWVVLALMLGITTVIFLLGNQCGLGYTFDSFLYLEISEQIGSKGFWNNDGFNFRPPAYPLLIKILDEENIILANLFCLWASLILIFRFSKEISTWKLRIFYCILITLATPVYLTHSFLWTEPLFTTVLLTAFFALHKFIKNNQSIWLTVSLIAFLLLPTIRLAGTFISIPVFLWLFLFLRAKEKWKAAASLILLIGIFFLWVFHFNAILSQGSSLLSFSDFLNQIGHNLANFLDGISIWFIPHLAPPFLRIVIGILIVVILGFGAIWSLRKDSLSIYGIIAGCLVLYYFALHPYFHVTFYTVERYLAPMYALLFLTFFKWINHFYEKSNKSTKKMLLIALTLQCIYSGLRVSNNILLWSKTRCSENYTEVSKSAKTDFEKRYSEIKEETLNY